MKNLITFCVRRPVTMIMIMAAVLLGGTMSFFSLPLDRLPEISLPQVTVEAVYAGMAAAGVRSSVTIPLEDALSPVKGLEGIRSVSRDGASLVNLSFRWGTSASSAAALVREAVDAVYPSLPEGVRKPTVIAGGAGEEAHAIVAVRSPRGDKSFARNLAEYDLRARFRRLDGAGSVILVGGETEEIRVSADQERIVSWGLNGNDLAEMIAAETTDIPGGSAREGNLELTVISAGRPGSAEELAALVLPSASGVLSLGDVAETRRENSRGKSLFIFQDEEQTALEIYRRPGADPVKLSRDIRKLLKEASTDFSRDAVVSLVYDASSSIMQGAVNLMVSAVLAAAAVVFILAFFTNRFRFSLFTILALPLSAGAAMILLCLTGRSLNSMSLGGLALGIGLVSDTSVIVLDLLRRNFRDFRERPAPAGIGALASSVSGSSMAGTLTTVVVFVPVLFLPGPLGSLFGDLALTLTASVITGWLYAQFCLPSLFRLFFPQEILKKTEKARVPEIFYRPLLKKALRRPLPLIAGTAFFCAAGFFFLFCRPAEFVARETVREIEVAVEFLPGTLPKTAGVEGIRVSRLLSGFPEIAAVFGRMGAEDEDVGRRADPDYKKERLLFRCLLRGGANPDEVLDGIRGILSSFGGTEAEITVAYPRDRTEELLGLGSSQTLAVKGTSPEETASASEAAAGLLRWVAGSGLANLSMRPSGTRPELRFIPNRETAASLGVSAVQVAGAVYAAAEGLITGTMETEGRTLDIRVAGKSGGYAKDQLEKLPLVFPSQEDGSRGPVFLDSLGRIERHEAEAVLARQDRSDIVYLDLLPAPGGEKELEARIKELPGNISRADESVFSRYRSSLIVTMVLVIILLYLTLAAQFESFVLPFILMLSIPLSLAGAGLALFISGSGLNSESVLGLIVLFGLAVNNGIVLYEAGVEKISSGLPAAQAVYSGALERFRPVLITSLTTVFALLPLAAAPESSQRSMAAAVLGGIAVSALLAFFVMPPVFILLFRSPGRRHD